MNKFQAAKNASYKLIIVEAENDPASVNLIPRFATGINRLKIIVTEIDTIAIQQSKDITGVTDNKNFLLDELKDNILDVSGAIHSYATTQGNMELAAKCDFKITAINHMNNSELLTTAGIVLEEAGKLSQEILTNEGISADEMTEFNDIYTQCKEAFSQPREAIIDRSGHTQKLDELFEEAATLKKGTLDRLATQFQRKAPAFYAKYKAAATVIYKRSSKPDEPEAAK
jgi:hypothetical protein